MSKEAVAPEISLVVFRQMVRNSVRLGAMIWNDRRGTVLARILLFVAVSAAPFLQSGVRGLLINTLIQNVAIHTLTESTLKLLLILVAVTIIPAFLFVLDAYTGRLFWFFLEEKFELLLLKRKGEIDIAIHEDPKKNDLFQRVREQGIWRIQNFVDRQFYILQNLLEVAIASVILMYAQWWLFFVVLAGTLPELMVEIRYGREVWGIHSAQAEHRRRFWDLHRHFNDLPALIELKIFQNTQHFLSRVADIFTSFQRETIVAEVKKLWRQLGSLCLSQAVIAFATVWFFLEVIHGQLQIGTLTFVLASIASLRQSLSGLFSNVGRQYSDSLFITDVFTLVDLQPVIPSAPTLLALPAAATPEIVFDNVTFSYPGSATPVLKNISLRIPAGEKLALVGVNGAGKTTLVKLLCRFYDPSSGRITVGGHDLKRIDLETWYGMLGVIFQDYAQYHFKAKEAIAIGRTHVPMTDMRIRAAAAASEADTFIQAWEHGYEQTLGKQFSGGLEPSTGQWQKLALARTFYRDPHIFVLDEPTSSIDAEAEANIFEKLEALPKDRTVILISHRFSTVRRASNIAVIEDGAIREYGTHDELLRLNLSYAHLFRLQAKGYV